MQNIHDMLFKKTLSNKKNAVDFLEETLPEEILQNLDLSEIEFDDNSYILENFKELFSDSVLITKTKEGNRQADIYILLEYKSYLPDQRDLFMQLFSYIYSMYSKDLKEKKDFRIVIPLVFYHAKREWTVPHNFKDLFRTKNIFKQYLPDFKYILYDTHNYRDEDETKYRKNILLYSTMTAMKYAFEKNDITHVAHLFRRLAKYGFLEDIKQIEILIIYVFETHKKLENQIKDIIIDINEEGGGNVLTFEDYFTKKGVEIGIHQGIQQERAKFEKERERERAKLEKEKAETVRKMLSDKVDTRMISRYTGLSLEEIEKYRKV